MTRPAQCPRPSTPFHDTRKRGVQVTSGAEAGLHSLFSTGGDDPLALLQTKRRQLLAHNPPPGRTCNQHTRSIKPGNKTLVTWQLHIVTIPHPKTESETRRCNPFGSCSEAQAALASTTVRRISSSAIGSANRASLLGPRLDYDLDHSAVHRKSTCPQIHCIDHCLA